MLEAHQMDHKKEVLEGFLKSKKTLQNQTNAPNHFPYLDKDTSEEFTSLTRSEKPENSSNVENRDVRKTETAQINLCDNFNTTLNLFASTPKFEPFK